MSARRVMTAEEARAAGFAPVNPEPRRVMTTEEAKAAGFEPASSRLPEGLQGLPAEPTAPEYGLGEPRSLSGTAMRSFGKGGSFGFGDEAGGVMGASDELGRRMRTALGATGEVSAPVENEKLPLREALVARYRRERDANRSELAAGQKENPRTAVGAELAGSLLSPSPFAKAKGAAGFVKMGAKIGGLNAFGDSDADLTKSEFGKAASDTLGGAEAGGLVGAAGAPIAAGAGWLGGKIANAATRVRADKMAKIQEVLDKEIASQSGDLGAATQSGNRLGENLQRTAQGVDPGAVGHAVVDPATQARALGALDDPRLKELLSGVANHDVDSLPDRYARFKNAQDKLAQLKAARDPTAAKQFSEYFAPGKVMSEEVAPRVKTGLTNAALGGATGLATGTAGALGAVASGHANMALPALGMGVMGGVTAGMGGGTGMKRMLFGSKGLTSSPRVQAAALDTAGEALNRSANGLVGGVSQQSAELTLRKPKDQQDEDAVAAWINGT